MEHILVCIKAVPSTNQVQVDGQFRLQRNGVNLQWNVADEAALEAALLLKNPETTVTVLTMGPQKLEESLKELLCRGADRAVLLTDSAMAGADPLATATALQAAITKLGHVDLILCGRRAIDGETGQVPGMLAGALGIPCITNTERLEIIPGGIRLNRRLENGISVLEAATPLVASLCEYTYQLRLPGIRSIQKAKNRAVEIFPAADLGLPIEMCGLKGSQTKVVSMSNKFPGLRKGPKETNITQGVTKLLQVLQEVDVCR